MTFEVTFKVKYSVFILIIVFKEGVIRYLYNNICNINNIELAYIIDCGELWIDVKKLKEV